ncbi:MAG: hypothetical protein GWN99_16580 [Gemmatimonadetes bacterium]|uniref:Uncharacterized protein n=1 Tax=Candidatus Kutchimonas denitrificans TaxID=3056748 RepID=A0AAE4Z5W6_9BACT|nr:hypothetical protein [Gemmatimonadota bacterium]NIR74405.1 hypothetical protein [Candidatus Kutchimonas denitrificans]NIS02656.1 hypothetical protein [Gemmatimonadota bacterium]NIT68531.1 hypothetical protein [Gemmatimonadota bacterium]NIU52008.1 hypothetical protein [Gemmatimonadota bacterium]
MKPAARFAFVLLILVALAHLLRMLLSVDIVARGIAVPMWVSAIAVLIFAGVAVWLWRESRV